MLMAPPPLERIETACGLLSLHAAVLLLPPATLMAPPPLERIKAAGGLLLLSAAASLPPPATLDYVARSGCAARR